MNFREAIGRYVTCEIHMKNEVHCLARMDNGNWVNVKADGTLDEVEVSPADLESLLETMESLGANVRFTNHSAA